jgi:hypothetical protein
LGGAGGLGGEGSRCAASWAAVPWKAEQSAGPLIPAMVAVEVNWSSSGERPP